MKTKLTELFNIKYPIIQAPMFLVSNTAMVIEAMKSGIAGCIPALNYRTLEELKSAISFTEKLKDRVARILDVLGMSLYQGLDIISYSFLLPILPALLEMLQNPEMDMIALKGMLNSSYITASAIVLQKIIEKLSGKIASKKTSDDVSDEMDLDPTPESDIV